MLVLFWLLAFSVGVNFIVKVNYPINSIFFFNKLVIFIYLINI